MAIEGPKIRIIGGAVVRESIEGVSLVGPAPIILRTVDIFHLKTCQYP